MQDIHLNDEVAQLAIQLAAGDGCSVEEYIERLVRSDQGLPISPELEAELLKGFSSTSRIITVEEWEAKRQALRDRANVPGQ